MMSHSSQWTVDEAAGHLAHPSGLYAYFSSNPTESGAILCVGPFSSYTRRLTRADVLSQTRGAIEALELRSDLRNCYTLWGTYSDQNVDSPNATIEILGQPFEFVANPSFRTTALLCDSKREKDSKVDLHREWHWNNETNTVGHRVGLKFCFSRTEQNCLCCDVSAFEPTRDLGLLRDKLRPLLVKALCTTAFSVLNSTSTSLYPHSKESLFISVANDILSPE